MTNLTSEPKAVSRLQEQIHERAAFWVARLRADSCTEADRREFALWLSARPEHTTAMDAMLELWADLAVTEKLPLSSPAQGRREQPRSRRWLGFGLAAAACALFAAILAPGFFNQRPQPLIYQTDIGEQLQVQLADGSSIILNTNSKISVSLGERLRRVVLNRGEAYFEVVRLGREHPFMVDIGSAEVWVLGTAFNIRLHGDRGDITVTEGVVRVTEKGHPANRAAASKLLYASQSISSGHDGLAPVASTGNDVEIAWRKGRIVARAMPLSELVQELSRYHSREILIAEADLAQTTVSGVFELEDPDTILRALEHSVGVTAMPLEDDSVLLIKTPR
ncbi:MAG: FecR domain-containing protein [Halieaceae bacterium]|nr:FecR domain-containing protein [Halieaceae bacterium]